MGLLGEVSHLAVVGHLAVLNGLNVALLGRLGGLGRLPLVYGVTVMYLRGVTVAPKVILSALQNEVRHGQTVAFTSTSIFNGTLTR